MTAVYRMEQAVRQTKVQPQQLTVRLLRLHPALYATVAAVVLPLAVLAGVVTVTFLVSLPLLLMA